MYGPNVERILKNINEISSAVNINPSFLSYRLSDNLNNLTVTGSTGYNGGDDHNHTVNLVATGTRVELAYPYIPLFSPSISKAISQFEADIEKVRRIQKQLYVTPDKMHNSIGSPYTELYNCLSSINVVKSYMRTLNYMGEKIAYMSSLNIMGRCLLDCKISIQMYADNLERGYDQLIGEQQK
jgi:hypothetical protein